MTERRHVTALLGSPIHRWTPWLADHLGSRDLLVLDPMDAQFGPPARAVLMRGQEPLAWRLVGSLDASRQPLALARATAEMLPKAQRELVVQLPNYRPQPVVRQLLQALLAIVRPDEILVPQDSDIEMEGWGMGPETVPLTPALPPMVETARRRSRWIEAQEHNALHEVALDQTVLLDARIGCGESVRLPKEPLLDPILYAEKSGSQLYGISVESLPENAAARAMQHTHTLRFHNVLESDFEHLVCALVRQNGEPLGLGMIERAEFARGRFLVRSQAIPGGVATSLQLGCLRVDGEGKELGEIKPWSV